MAVTQHQPALRGARQLPFPQLTRRSVETLQVNLGYRCNQACHHCHVEAGPTRTESMDLETIRLVVEVARARRITRLDITGGAPELNPHFRLLVREARGAGIDVTDRCNLTIVLEPGMEDLAAFLAEQGVHIVASLPCYSAANTDAQRGRGVFERSLAAVRRLNALGYGVEGSGFELDFVYNPVGAVLPPDPRVLEADYKRELGRHGVRFNRLLTITNMPIKRFRHALERDGQLETYETLLYSSFEADNLENLMCRNLISVDWQGYLYDCDFNQMLGLDAGQHRRHLRTLLDNTLEGDAIAVGRHCYGCAAGRGSSCSGALKA